VLIFTGSLGIFSGLLYLERLDNKLSEFDNSLYNYAIDIAESLDIDSYGEVEFDPSIIKINEKIFPFSLGKSFISVMDINNKVVAHSQNTTGIVNEKLTDEVIEKVLKKGVSYSSIVSRNGVSFRVINYLLPVLKIDSPLILHITVPLTYVEQSSSKLRKFLITSLTIIALLSFFAGYFFMGRALLPIIEITKKANLIEVKNLNERVPVPVSEDEISELANTINKLFERLSLSFEAQERFVQDASHQLKTPLAIIKGELDLFKSGVRSEVELGQFITNMSDELNSLIKLTNDLLILARVDSGEKNLSLENVSIDEVILTQASRLSRFAKTKNVSINLNLDSLQSLPDQNIEIYADYDLIGVLFYNFIENAIKYSPENSLVQIKCELIGDEIFVAVTDQGPGIKLGQEDKIFDRFYRSEGTGQPGSGLGLAICHAVATVHKATIWAINNEKLGATFYFKMKIVRGVS
jgi:signal transduction histidine kinase